MYLLLILALSYPLISMMLDTESRSVISNPTLATSVVSSSKVDTLRWFSIAANQYVQKTPFATTAVSTVTWNQIRAISEVPAAMSAIEVPSTWVVKGNTLGWSICVSEEEKPIALALIEKYSSDQQRGVVSVTPSLVYGFTSATAGAGQYSLLGYIGANTNVGSQNACSIL